MRPQRRRHNGWLPLRYLHTAWCKDRHHDGLCVTALTNRIKERQRDLFPQRVERGDR